MISYPFAAIVGQPELKLALLLAAVDWRLSVLLKGDKGSGKSTAARALSEILPANAPFINLPIGTTEDRLLGGLDLAQALAGQATLKHGLIHQANGGVLYIDEVNLLADSLTDALLDAASSGRHFVERDGFSASAAAEFILLGSMNTEEGVLRPQLLDRFALCLDVEAPVVTEERSKIVNFRLRFDQDARGFCAAFESEQECIRRQIAAARTFHVEPTTDSLQAISTAVAEAGVRSLRADLAAVRAAAAHAALNQRKEIISDDIDAVLPFVLRHRSKQNLSQNPRQQSKDSSSSPTESSGEKTFHAEERVFPVKQHQTPELSLKQVTTSSLRGRSAPISAAPVLDVMSSFNQSFRRTGDASLDGNHLVFHSPRASAGVRFIFVVDSSGSHAARQRMSDVKGVIRALLESSVDAKDEIAVISFRGARAEIVLGPCRGADDAQRILEFLPTGGRTPLAHALELARTLTNHSSVVVLVTDGRANVSLSGGDPWEEALASAQKINCASVVVDSSLDSASACVVLATALRARLVRLDELDLKTLLNVLRS